MADAPKFTAAAVTRIVRAATGSDLLRSRRLPHVDVIVVRQDYAVFGAFTPADSHERRTDRAHVAAIALRASGYVVVQEGDHLDVTLPKEA